MSKKLYDELIKMTKRAGALSSAEGILAWDQDTMMRPGELNERSAQLEVVGSLHHELITHERIGEILETIDTTCLSTIESVNVSEIRRGYQRAVRIPNELVEEYSGLIPLANEAWKKARANNNFKLFLPKLERVIEITKEMNHHIDPDKPPYQVLFDGYEYGTTLEQVDTFFEQIKSVTVPLIEAIKEQSVPDTTALHCKIRKEKQLNFCKNMTAMLGFDFNKGRLDLSVHPFSCNGRITTRLTNGLFDTLSSTIHEAGHGMYEHNLPSEHWGTPLGDARSYGVHESQSRLWENHVGKSMLFWKAFYPQLQKKYHEAFTGITVDEFYRMINVVEPGYIRTEADELTYGLHVILRYEIEQAIMSGALETANIPEAWNEKMQTLLGITPPTDSLGCLQDVHWGNGLFGYFPTYTLGSMMSAQIWNAAVKSLPNLVDDIANLNFSSLNDWLRVNIHQHGCRYSTTELITRATGKPPGAEDYTNYLTDKFTTIYNV